MQIVYIITKNIVEFGDVKQDLHERFGPTTQLVFVSSVSKLAGTVTPDVYITSRAKFRRDYKELLQYLDSVGAKDVTHGCQTGNQGHTQTDTL